MIIEADDINESDSETKDNKGDAQDEKYTNDEVAIDDT